MNWRQRIVVKKATKKGDTKGGRSNEVLHSRPSKEVHVNHLSRPLHIGSQVLSPTHVSKYQHGGKVPTFEPQETNYNMIYIH